MFLEILSASIITKPLNFIKRHDIAYYIILLRNESNIENDTCNIYVWFTIKMKMHMPVKLG